MDKIKKQLFFGQGNAKLSENIATFSLPAGWVCTGAKECLCKANRQTGHLTDGKDQKFRCYAATEEIYPCVRQSRWNNFEILKGKNKEEMIQILTAAVGRLKENIVRLHVSGDYWSQDYFDAWLEICRLFPQKTFYGYTKSLTFWVRRLDSIPPNLRLTASKGGKFDTLIDKYHLVSAEVVFSQYEAKKKRKPIDYNDFWAIKANRPFAILLHGTQKAHTKAAAAWKRIFATVGGYSKKSRTHD